MEALASIIGENLRRLRDARALSLDSAAELCGVSKSMLGQIERKESNPTITTLWKIAAGFRVPLPSLLQAPRAAFELFRAADQSPFFAGDERRRLFTLFGYEAPFGFEALRLEIEGKETLETRPHAVGSTEFLTIASGKLQIELGDETLLLEDGDAIRFEGGVLHRYHNPTETLCRAFLLIHYQHEDQSVGM